MENWRRYVKEISDSERQEISSKFYRDPPNKRDYDKEPLTGQEISLLSDSTLSGEVARQAMLMHIYVYQEIPDFSPTVHNMIVDTAEKSGKEISKKAEEVDWKPDFSDKDKEKKPKLGTKQQPDTFDSEGQGYQGYPDNEYDQNMDCWRISVDPLTGEKRDPEVEWDSSQCSDEEMNRNCWIQMLTLRSMNTDDTPADDFRVPYSVLEISNSSIKDITFRILDSNGRVVKISDLFLKIVEGIFGEVNSQKLSRRAVNSYYGGKEYESGPQELIGQPVGFVEIDGTMGIRTFMKYLDNNSIQQSKFRFCPIPFHLVGDKIEWNIQKGSRGSTTKVILPTDQTYMVQIIQKQNGTTQVIPAQSDNLGGEHIYGSSSEGKTSVGHNYIMIEDDLRGTLTDEQWDELDQMDPEEYNQTIIAYKKSPDIDISVKHKDTDSRTYTYDEDGIKSLMWQFMYLLDR